MFLVDTNVVSELRKAKAGRANAGVAEWASSTPTGRMFVSTVTVYELELGALLLERRHPAQGAVLREWLEESVMQSFVARIVPIDEVVARRAAPLHVPDPAPFRDALIGATALVHRMAVVTRNESDFRRFDGLEVLNPWTA